MKQKIKKNPAYYIVLLFVCIFFKHFNNKNIFLFTDDVVVAISNSGAVKVWTLTGSENMVGTRGVIIHLCTTV